MLRTSANRSTSAFVTVKSYDTEWATHFIKRYVKPEGFFLSIQNCWNDPVIGDIVGANRQLGCIASHIDMAFVTVKSYDTESKWRCGSRAMSPGGGEPGRDHGHVVFRVGEQDGRITERSKAIAQKLNCIDDAYATDNLWGERWAKLCQNGMGNAISAMSGLGSQDMADDPRCRSIRIHLAKEGAKVGIAMGLNVVEISGKPAEFWAAADQGDIFEEADALMESRGGNVNWLASMAQDIKKGRHSEIDFMNGLIASKGREVAVPTPYNDAIVDAMHGIDDHSLAQGAGNVDRIMKVVNG